MGEASMFDPVFFWRDITSYVRIPPGRGIDYQADGDMLRRLDAAGIDYAYIEAYPEYGDMHLIRVRHGDAAEVDALSDGGNDGNS